MNAESLYFHFPFCEARCHYCDFYALGSNKTRPQDPDRFEKALRQEVLQTRSSVAEELDTVFFGGGTPSLTRHDSMARALEPLWEKTRISSQTEWTIEANPSSITLESFRFYRSYGINRVSMGVQSLQDRLLSKLGRVHSQNGALQALETVFEAGFNDVSVDLLCGVPGQSIEDLEESVRLLTKFPITHLSCYLLTLPPHHSMYPDLPKDDVQLSHLLWVHDRMTALGFEHYEISNFAKPGHRARHNLNYWQGKSYLGLGPSAHSFDSSRALRWKNISSLHQYAERLEKGESPRMEEEKLTPNQTELEKWMLALRLSDGFPSQWLDSTLRKGRAKMLRSEGLLEVHPRRQERLRLTPRGFALSDHVIRALA